MTCGPISDNVAGIGKMISMSYIVRELMPLMQQELLLCHILGMCCTTSVVCWEVLRHPSTGWELEHWLAIFGVDTCFDILLQLKRASPVVQQLQCVWFFLVPL